MIGENPPPQLEILEQLVELFKNAAQKSLKLSKEPLITQTLQGYLEEMAALQAKLRGIAQKNLSYWMTLIARGGIDNAPTA